jgi:hypothetical protein
MGKKKSKRPSKIDRIFDGIVSERYETINNMGITGEDYLEDLHTELPICDHIVHQLLNKTNKKADLRRRIQFGSKEKRIDAEMEAFFDLTYQAGGLIIKDLMKKWKKDIKDLLNNPVVLRHYVKKAEKQVIEDRDA